jgi:hypothetical protein
MFSLQIWLTGLKNRSRKFFSDRVIQDLYVALIEKVKQEISLASFVSFTIDAWDDSTHKLIQLTSY